ncbi:MAG: ketoacyl-ACP synthase III [Terrimicrobiaceae bacterium]|nr:ketoacyl-ACP synthase III [Terrimicrobiaceae bacterium]
MKRPRTKARQPSRAVSIIATGSYVPERILTNADLEQMVETTDEWIVTRTGIRERRIAAEGEFTSHLAARAAQRAMDMARVKPSEIDLIIVATVTPDTFFPSTACHVQRQIGASNAACFDVSAACSGFLYGLEIAQQFIANHTVNTVLVIGADKLSSIVNWQDRNTCVLFGDGAGAAILRYRPDSHGVITTFMGSDGNYGDILHMPGGGCAQPVTPENYHLRLNTLQMNGRETFKQAVTSMHLAARKALEQSGLAIEDITCIIPHQANLRIIEALAERLRVPLNKFHVNLDRYGNTSAAAVAIALDEANRTGRFEVGDYILMVVFGGGLTYASSVVQW